MAYGSILGQNPTAQNTLYNNAQTSSIITANNVQGAIDQLFTSVSNGKQEIASAITDKGVSTSASDSWTTMAWNIGRIVQGAGPGSYSATGQGGLGAWGSYQKIADVPEGTTFIAVGLDNGFGIFDEYFTRIITLRRANIYCYFRVRDSELQAMTQSGLVGGISYYYVFR